MEHLAVGVRAILPWIGTAERTIMSTRVPENGNARGFPPEGMTVGGRLPPSRVTHGPDAWI